MAGETQNPNGFGELDDEFVAYLDGEAEPGVSRKLEALIARDEDARQRLQSLERAWEALDVLPSSQAGDRLASSTVEMIALREADERRDAQAAAQSGDRGIWVVAGCTLVALASLGFALISGWQARDNDRLLRNLPVIEQLDEYRQIADIEFLRDLADTKQFEKRPQPNGNPRF